MLIDSIMVKDEYRGQGLQRKMLQFAQKQAEKLKMNGLVATVHPDNIYSLNNFVHEDYKVINRLNIHGGQREILLKEI
ncbi:MAG: GNAT family N-acetyltransferase [Bacilli bacterium]|nr:GNAT family N-acetyltransferase [Bacilli bacterium]